MSSIGRTCNRCLSLSRLSLIAFFKKCIKIACEIFLKTIFNLTTKLIILVVFGLNQELS